MALGLGVGGAAAAGIQSGFEMGRQADQDADRKTQRARDNARQDALDTEHRDAVARQNTRQDKVDTEHDDDRALAAVNDEMGDHRIAGAGLAAQYGGPDKIPGETGSAYAAKANEIDARRRAILQRRYAPIVEKEQQWAKDISSRIETGQMNADDLSPADTVRWLQASSRRPVGDFFRPVAGGNSKVGQGIADTTAGVQTKNPGLMIQGANVLMGPEVNEGIGHVTPDGSTITSKSLFALVPAPQPAAAPPPASPMQNLGSALNAATTPTPQPAPGAPNGMGTPSPDSPAPAGAMPAPASPAGDNTPQPAMGAPSPDSPAPAGAMVAPPAAAPAPGLQPHDDSNLLMPVLQVTAQHPDGSEVTYHAPVTQGRGTGPDDPVHPGVSMSDAFNRMGKMGVLEAWVNTPAARAKIEQGQKDLGGDSNSFLGAYYAMHGDAKALLPAGTQDPTSQKIAAIKALAKDQGVDFTAAARMLDGKNTMSPTERKLEAIADDPDMSDAEKVVARRVALGTEKVGKNGLVGLGAAGGGGGGGKSGKGGSTGTSTALGGVAAPDAAHAPDATVDFWAKAVIAGDKDWQVGLSRSKTGAQLIEAVKRRVPQMATELGLQPQDIGTARATSAALGSTLKDVTKRQTAVDLFSSKLEKDMQTYDQLLTSEGSNSPLLLNEPINALRRKFSSPGLAQLDLAAQQVGTEYERLITGGTLSVAQLHSGAADDAKRLINGNMPPAQARATMTTMLREMTNARTAAHESVANVQNQMRALGNGPTGGVPPRTAPAPRRNGLGTPAPAAAPAAARPPPPPVGTVMNGYKYTGGDPSNQASWARVQ